MSTVQTAVRPSARTAPSFGDVFDPRRNAFDLLRLVLAGLVVVDHGIVMATGGQHTWGESAIGDIAVDGFFILSGFLITRSYLRVDSFPRFVWHRALRILPGFWACLVLTALVVAPLAALLTGLPASTAFTAAPSALRYVGANAGLLITQYDIAGLLADNPNPLVFNGSLWTLALEAFCYAVVGLLGLVGLLRRARWTVPALATVSWVLIMLQDAGVDVVIGDNVLRMLLCFLVGATLLLYADRIPHRWWLAVAAAVILWFSIITLEDYRVLGVVPAAYLLLWVGTALPHPPQLKVDLSYGVYIYHWPLLQLMAASALVELPTPVFVLLGLVAVVPVSLASWFAVENRALQRKSWTPRRWSS